MIKRKDSWSELSNLWLEEKGVDPETLAKSVRRKTWSMRIMASTEAFFGLAAVVFGIWLVFRGHYYYDLLIGTYIILFAGIGTLATLWARKGAWQASTGGIEGQLRLTLKRAHSGVKLALVNLWALIPALGLILGIFYIRWDDLIRREKSDLVEVWVIFTLGFLAILGTGVWAVWYKARKKREIKRLEALLRDYSD